MRRVGSRCRYRHARGIGSACIGVVAAAAVDLLSRRPVPLPPAATVLPNGQDVVLETDDGIRLGAWYFPVAGDGPAVLVCNGNGGDRSVRVELAAALNRMGLSVLLFDYRGYGGNPGTPLGRRPGRRRARRAGVAGRAARRREDRVLRRIPRRRSRCRPGGRSGRPRHWCCGRRSRRWPTWPRCTTRGCRSAGC